MTKNAKPLMFQGTGAWKGGKIKTKSENMNKKLRQSMNKKDKETCTNSSLIWSQKKWSIYLTLEVTKILLKNFILMIRNLKNGDIREIDTVIDQSYEKSSFVVIIVW